MDDVLPEIKKGLEEKLEAMVRRDLYTKYKTAPTEEERENARQEYLEKVGMHRSFRWYFFSFGVNNRSVARSCIWHLRRKLMMGVMAKADYTHKPSAFESEIHPSHKTSFYALRISPLQGANLRKRKL